MSTCTQQYIHNIASHTSFLMSYWQNGRCVKMLNRYTEVCTRYVPRYIGQELLYYIRVSWFVAHALKLYSCCAHVLILTTKPDFRRYVCVCTHDHTHKCYNVIPRYLIRPRLCFSYGLLAHLAMYAYRGNGKSTSVFCDTSVCWCVFL